MKIAIVGAGEVGQALAPRWIQAGHQVVFGVRAQSLEKYRSRLALVETIEEATRAAEVVLLAVPHEVILEVADSLADPTVVIDASNWSLPDWSGLKLGFSTSGAEEIQKRIPRHSVVKAFNHYGAKVLGDPDFGGPKAVLYFCGDDAAALAKVGQLVGEAGFEGVAIPSLRFARVLEPLAQIWIENLRQFGPDQALALIQR